MLGKVVLMMVVVGVLVWMLTARARPPRDGGGAGSSGPKAPSPPPSPVPQPMAACAHCGTHLPRGEGVEADGQFYCSPAHRALGPRDGR